MSGPSFRSLGLSRRRFSALLLNGAALWAARAAAEEPRAADRGLGGTGAARVDPAETLGQDRGIGGTGVIGTIRRFGSIVVNDLRVAFPADVRVLIDGRPSTSRDLRLGHVARVLARRHGSGLATRAIVVRSEVVGRIEAAGPRSLVVLGQRVDLGEELAALGHRRGDTVAVSGLRRLDGTIVASLVEARPPGPERLNGPLGIGPDDMLTIGALKIAGLARHLAGRRVSLQGRAVGDVFHPTRVEVEPRLPFAAASRLSIEDYVARTPDGLRFGSGFEFAEDRGAAFPNGLSGAEGVRAVVTATVGSAGRLSVEAIRVEHRGRPAGQGTRRGPADNVGRSPPTGRDGPHSAAAPGRAASSTAGEAPGGSRSRGGGHGGRGGGPGR